MRIKKEYIYVGITVLLIVVALIGIGSGWYFFAKYKTTQERLETVDVMVDQEAVSVLEKARKHIIVPDEAPKIMTVNGAEQLKQNQLFFLDAQDGDKVLIFQNAKRAIIYRPSQDRIVNVAPILLNGQPKATGSAVLPSNNPRIAIRNGTTITGLSKKLEEKVQGMLDSSEIVEKDNAKKTDYQSTVVVVLNEAMQKPAESLASKLNAAIISLPKDEPKPDADILIIAGLD